jgi:hypothetical protein
MKGTLANMGIIASPWRPFFSVASVIALTNRMVASALAGVGLDALVPRTIALIAALVVLAIAVPFTFDSCSRRFFRTLESIEPIFPTEKATEPGRS